MVHLSQKKFKRAVRAFIRREFPLTYVTDEALRYLRHELRDQVTEAPSPRGPLFDVLSLLQQQTDRRIEGHHVLAWRSSRRPSLRQLPSTGANVSHAAAHESTQVREADGNLAPVNTPLGAEENGGAVATIAATTAWTSTVENPASTAVEATPALTTAAKLAADDVAEEKHATAVPAAVEKLSVAAIAVAEEKGTTAVIAVAEVKVTTAASSADAAQTLADSGDDSSDDDVVWIPAPSGLPVTTDTGSVLNADDGRDDSEASETEWVPTENLAAPTSTAPQLYNTRAITNSYMRNGKRVYLVEWEQTEEPATNLPRNIVAAYNRRRRALARRTFIEDQAGHGRGRLRNSEPAPERRRRRPLRRLRRALHF
ncbi:hypothetical protein PF005_g13662 [Phytophthora fragariae]|uniref:Chromo domain-containing protein n=1 Tax=Phytophthora fragariae TaxID=53985 RepID=A0A6A3RSC2_9STRA|nr:hypothetical protein PF009_g14960 [Phytophthora fragariae]KAE9102277.1 hypothetical protein PF006_g22470 [Phytophthora fragariae]KAE9204798.1 hypothetical protein PF005_g13662 [Phytophthora fragariae]KAE9224630.1 hypothetical protein PF002_g14639 [Phytophthora fragariae]KAE9307860.1 hypothetical protein PF001_g11418 [Phytophthora fragariae]